MGVTFTKYETTITAHIKGDIDHHFAKDMRESIDLEIEKNTPEMLILDFKEVAFMDSSGIGLVMGRYKLTNILGCELKVINLSPHIKKVMKLAGIEKLLTMDR